MDTCGQASHVAQHTIVIVGIIARIRARAALWGTISFSTITHFLHSADIKNERNNQNRMNTIYTVCHAQRTTGFMHQLAEGATASSG